MDTEEGAALFDAPKVHGCCPFISFFCRKVKDRADEPLAADAEKPWIRVCLCEFIQAGEYLHILLAGLSKADARIKDDVLFFHTGGQCDGKCPIKEGLHRGDDISLIHGIVLIVHQDGRDAIGCRDGGHAAVIVLKAPDIIHHVRSGRQGFFHRLIVVGVDGDRDAAFV